MNPPAGGLTIADLQRRIEVLYGAKDAARGDSGTFLWFAEEVGELASALRSGSDEELAFEMADVLAWLITLANVRGINLEEAVLTKYGHACPGCSTVPVPVRSSRETLAKISTPLAEYRTDLDLMGPPSVNNQDKSSRIAREPWVRVTVGFLVGLASLLGPASLARAATPRAVEVEDCRVGFDGRYKVGTWTPIFVLLKGGPDGFAGEMHAVVEDENGTPTTVRQVVQVGPGGTQRVTTYVRPGTLTSDFAALRFYDGKTGRMAVPEYAVGAITSSPNQPKLEPIGQGDYPARHARPPLRGRGDPQDPWIQCQPGERPPAMVGPERWLSPRSTRSGRPTSSQVGGTGMTQPMPW